MTGPGVHRDGDRGARRGVLQRVADEVVDHLADPCVVGVNDHGLRPGQQGDRTAGLHRAGGVHGLGGDAGQVHRPPVQRAVLVQPGQQQQVLDQQPHPGRLLLDAADQPEQLVPAGRLALLQAELGQPPDRGQRRPQLVAGVGHEPAHPVLGVPGVRLAGLPGPVGGLDPAEHGVERPGQPADLGALAGMSDPAGQVTAGDRLRGLLDPGERGQAGPDQDEPDAGEQRDADGTGGGVDQGEMGHGAVHVVQAQPGDQVPSVFQRPHQDPPRVPGGAGGRRGERLAGVPQLRGRQSRPRDAVL